MKEPRPLLTESTEYNEKVFHQFISNILWHKGMKTIVYTVLYKNINIFCVNWIWKCKTLHLIIQFQMSKNTNSNLTDSKKGTVSKQITEYTTQVKTDSAVKSNPDDTDIP